MPEFKKATRTVTFLTLGLEGPSGAGKTFTALKLAGQLAEHAGGRIAGIDSERGKMAAYADGDPYDFDHLILEGREPADYVEAINLAATNGYRVAVIDSASHEWRGAQAIADRVGAQRRGNTWSGWGVARPAHENFVDTIVTAPMHTIVTFRSKQDTEQYRDADGKMKVRSLGLAPVTDSEMNYEFDLWATIDHETHELVISKTRINTIPMHSRWPLGDGLIEAYFAWAGGAEIVAGHVSDETIRSRILAAGKAAGVTNAALGRVVGPEGSLVAYVREHSVDALIRAAKELA